VVEDLLFVIFTVKEQIKCERELSEFICVDPVVLLAAPTSFAIKRFIDTQNRK
jgi:hypothetical protein